MSESLLELAVRKYGIPEAFLAELTPEQRERIPYEWRAWGRPEQLEPEGDWRVWFCLAGRGWGKSRTGAEFVRARAMKYPGCTIALIGRTAADVRDVMVRALVKPWPGGKLDDYATPTHVASTRSLHWKNGSRALTFSADEPKQGLGQNIDFFWCDELASWPSTLSGRKETGERSVMEEVWHEGLMLSLRGSGVPIDRTCGIVTTTPRPKKLVREILSDPTTHVTRGSTYDNRANLSPEFIAQVKRKYDGTRIGRQEIHAEVLDDIAGALWTYASIEDNRVEAAPDMVRVVVGVDPSGKSEDGDEQGIVVCGLGVDGKGYILADRSTHDTPDGWGRRAVQALVDFKADYIIGERNYGGDMVQFTVQQAAKAMGVRIFYKDSLSARGKIVRAEPISALSEQGRIKVVGEHEELERQMREYIPADGRSPDRMDAMVFAMTELMLKEAVMLGSDSVLSGARRGTEAASSRSDFDDEDEDDGYRSRSSRG